MTNHENILGFTLTDTGGQYTHLETRDMLADLANADKKTATAIRRGARAPQPQAAPVHVLAKRAANMYLERAARNIPVFAVTGSENTATAQFRYWLAAYLAGAVVRGRYYGDTIDAGGIRRPELERRAAAAGFHFVEIDASDYQ